MKQDIYTEVTNRIIAQLEQGVVPWQSPYFSKVGFPTNYSTGKRYQGINVFLLGSLRYTSPFFLTYKQAQELGGNVRKGERGAFVIKYGTYNKENGAAPTSEEAAEVRRFLKSYTVFHASQIEGISFPELEAAPEPAASAACDRAREIVTAMPNPPAFKEGAAVPCYRQGSDCVHMPERRFFHSEEAYYSTYFHELAHSTGHASRLARKSLMDNKGIESQGESRKIYAEEELVAEMGACFVGAHAGIVEPEIQNSASYLQGWIDALKSKDAKSWIIRAASQAQKAADYILNLSIPS
ncbi:MAG TPA: ArdC-like ssDNA-binding domain-containing protein [Candidatus Acidoferrum sp.]|nr:ArdC-like ssDNA-binding domain-containing protein [Candidatus Acidoferrum sp.]